MFERSNKRTFQYFHLFILFTVMAFFCPAFGQVSCSTVFNDNKIRFNLSRVNKVLAQYNFHKITLDRWYEINMKVNSIAAEQMFKNIEFNNNFEQNSPAQATQISPEKYEVTLNPKVLREFPTSGQHLILLHELGHTRLDHPQLLIQYPEKRSQYEIEADIFAALAYPIFCRRTLKLSEFINFVSTNVDTLPPGPLRSKIFKLLLY